MPAKFTFLIDGDACDTKTFSAILESCAEDILGCNRIIVFRGVNAFPLTLADSTKAYRALLDKVFFNQMPEEFREDSSHFTSYAIGVASAHTGNMKDHMSDIMCSSIPFLASSSTAAKKQIYVFVSNRVRRKSMPAGSFRVMRPDDLVSLAQTEVNQVGGGGTGVESLMTMMPSAARSLMSNFGGGASGTSS